MLKAPILYYFNYELLTIVETDTSNSVVTGVLLQQDSQSSCWHSVAFFFKTM